MTSTKGSTIDYSKGYLTRDGYHNSKKLKCDYWYKYTWMLFRFRIIFFILFRVSWLAPSLSHPKVWICHLNVLKMTVSTELQTLLTRISAEG